MNLLKNNKSQLIIEMEYNLKNRKNGKYKRYNENIK